MTNTLQIIIVDKSCFLFFGRFFFVFFSLFKNHWLLYDNVVEFKIERVMCRSNNINN